MAMQSETYQEKYSDRLPDWFRVEAMVSQVDDAVGIRCGIYARDGDVTLFSMHKLTAVYSPARPLRLNVTKRQILESVLETVSKQLAVLALEDK